MGPLGPVLRARVAELRPACLPPDPASRTAYAAGEVSQCDSWFSLVAADRRLNPDVLSSLPDNELMARLTAIPRIGPWTVQGALIIALQREDVVLPGDLALSKAVQAAYQLDHLPSPQEVLATAEKWRPYRSLATS